MENQVLSLELSKRFKELKIEIKTEYVWIQSGTLGGDIVWKIEKRNKDRIKDDSDWDTKYGYPAPTLSELLDIVPAQIEKHSFTLDKGYLKEKIFYLPYYHNSDKINGRKFFVLANPSPIEAVGKLIIYLKENNLI